MMLINFMQNKKSKSMIKKTVLHHCSFYEPFIFFMMKLSEKLGTSQYQCFFKGQGFQQFSYYCSASDCNLTTRVSHRCKSQIRGWSGGAMVLGKLSVPGRPTILNSVGQGPIALVVGASGCGLDIFTLIYPFSSFSLSLGDGSI